MKAMLVYWADSTGRRNRGHITRFQEKRESFCRRLPTESFAGPTVECYRHGFDVMRAVTTEIRALAKILAQQPVGVLVGAALPWAVRIAEVDVKAGSDPQIGVLRHFGALIPGQRTAELFWQSDDRTRGGIAHRFGAMSGKRRAVIDAGLAAMTCHARQVKQHSEP